MARMKTSLLVGLLLVVPGSSGRAQDSKAETPQGVVVLRFYETGHSGNVSALKTCLTPDAARDLEGAGAATILHQLASLSTTPTITQVKVDTKKKTATVSAEFNAGGSAPATPFMIANGAPPQSSVGVYPTTPLEQQQIRDSVTLATKQTNTSTPSAPVTYVDHFQMVLVGTEWKIRAVSRQAK